MLKERTTQDILAERRFNVQEMRRERDRMAKAMLQAHIDMLDAELQRRRKAR